MNYKATGFIKTQPSKSALFALISLFFAIILPQGIGIRFHYFIPHIDLPRVFIISTIVYGGILFATRRWHQCLKNAPVCTYTMVALIVWFLVTSYFSSSQKISFMFALRLIAIGPLYALAFCALTLDTVDIKKIVFFWMTLITGSLILYANLEFIFQTHLIPPHIRTSFYSIEYYREIIETIHYRLGIMLVQGPYIFNHNFGGMLCVFSGVTWLILEKNRILGILFTTFFIVAVYAVGMRSTTIAVIISIIVWLLYRKNIKNIIPLTYALLGSAIIISLVVGPKTAVNGVFLRKDMSYTMEKATYAGRTPVCSYRAAYIVEKLSLHLLPKEKIQSLLYNSGTLGIRLSGAILNIGKIKNWWLLGYGPGAFFMPDKVQSNAIQYDDPGLFLAIMFESGLFMAILLGFLIFRSVWLGFRYPKSNTWVFAIGIVSWSVFSLSSWAIWPMLPAFAFMVLTEIWASNHLEDKKYMDIFNDH
jgi:hypothetical protein